MSSAGILEQRRHENDASLACVVVQWTALVALVRQQQSHVAILIEDDPARGDLVRVGSKTERQRFVKALRGRTEKVREWLDSFPDARSMPESAIAFM